MKKPLVLGVLLCATALMGCDNGSSKPAVDNTPRQPTVAPQSVVNRPVDPKVSSLVSMAGRRIASADRDQDGKISESEIRMLHVPFIRAHEVVPGTTVQEIQSMAANNIHKIDANGDGILQLNERMPQAPAKAP